MQKLSVAMRDNYEIVMWAVSNDGKMGTALSFASERLKHDRTIALAAVTRSRYALRYVANIFKEDREIVLIAIRQSGFALEDSHLQHDEDVVLAAAAQVWESIHYADMEVLGSNREFLIRLGSINGVETLSVAHEEMLKDRGVVESCVRQNPAALSKAHKSLKRAPVLRRIAGWDR